MGEGEDLSDYVKQLQELHDRLGHLGELVKPAKQTINFLNSLNTRYGARVESVMSWAVSAPTLFTIPQVVSTLSAGDRRGCCRKGSTQISWGKAATRAAPELAQVDLVGVAVPEVATCREFSATAAASMAT